MRKKKERSKLGQTNNKAKQHSTPKVVTFPKKNEWDSNPRCIYMLLLSFFLYLKSVPIYVIVHVFVGSY